MNKLSYYIDWHTGVEGSLIVNNIHELDKPTHSKLLDPEGKPIPYKLPKLGFDLGKRT
jgi:hypothetical protein